MPSRRTFHLRYRDSQGKLRQHKIGDAAAISYDKARQKAMRLRSEVELGGNPLEERKALRSVPTLAEFIRDTYIPHRRLLSGACAAAERPSPGHPFRPEALLLRAFLCIQR